MNILYAIYLLFSAVILFALAVVGWRRRFLPAGREFALFSANIALVVGTYALELFQNRLDVLKLILRLESCFDPYIPSFWLLFTLVWCGYGHLATRTLRVALLGFSTVGVLLAQTNDYHGLVYTAIWVDSSGSFPLLMERYGLWSWIHFAYINICILLANIIFIRQFRHAQPLHRRQTLIMLVASFIPWITDIGYTLGVGNGIWLTAFALTITGMLFAWGLFRQHLLDMTPVARHGLVEMMRDPVMVFNEAGWLMDYNRAAKHLLCDPKIDSAQITKADILRNTPELAEALDAAERGGSTLFQYAGQVFSLSLTTLHPTAKTTLTLCLLHDITELSRAEEMLRDEREKLKEALERQIRFVDMVSHEYRTPLAIIKANLDILRERDTDAAARAESINYMQRAITRLVEVVEASFGVSRLAESAKGTEGYERIEVADFLAEVYDEVTALWRGVILNLPPETSTLNFVLADRAQLKTALFNLIDNAVKYGGKENPIDIGLENDGREICLSVADRGPVLTGTELEALRLKFRRGSNVANQDGVGIGLYLVDRIVTQHRGRLLLQPNSPTGMVSAIILPVCT